MKKLLTIIFSIVSFSALAAYQAGPMTTNKAAAYATTGQAPVFNGTQWVFVNTNAFGSGGGATNLTPWTTDINGASFSLTNAGSVHSTNFVGNGSGLTNIPGSALQIPLNVASMNVGTLTATNTYLTNGYFFETNATTGQWLSIDTNGVMLASNALSGVWWWRGPTNSMSGVGTTTNSQTSAVDGSTTNSGPIKASVFYGSGAGLTNIPVTGIATNTGGNPSSANYLRGDGSWATPAAGGGASRDIVMGNITSCTLAGSNLTYIGFSGISANSSTASWGPLIALTPACTYSNWHLSLGAAGAAGAGTNLTFTVYTNIIGSTPVATPLTMNLYSGIGSSSVTTNSGTLAITVPADVFCIIVSTNNLGTGTNVANKNPIWWMERINY